MPDLSISTERSKIDDLGYFRSPLVKRMRDSELFPAHATSRAASGLQNDQVIAASRRL